MTNGTNIIISIFVVLLVGLFQICINIKKTQRIRQFPLILVSGVIMIIGITSCSKYFDKITDFANSIEYLKHADIFIANVLLLVGYGILRLLARAIIMRALKRKESIQKFSFNFYLYDDEYDEWFLKKQWSGFRNYFLAIAIAVNLTTGFFLGLTWTYGEESSFWILVFPCAALSILNEVYNYINGQTKEEFMHNVFGEDADARRISNYYKLREVLENILPEPLLSAHTGCEFMGKETSVDYLRQMSQSENEEDIITAQFFNDAERYKVADVDCVQAAFQMMHRRNVLFYNPFYKDLSMYITLPLVTTLLKGKKCLVICGRKSVASDVKTWIEKILQEYSHMRSMWRVNYLSEKEPECEVGVITFTQIYDKHTINTNRSFLKETDFVLMIEPSVMLNTSQIALSIIAEEMESENQTPVYCICDRNTDGLVDTISHLLRIELTDVVAMPVPRCNYSAMSWDADGDFRRQQLFDKQTKYLGNGIELSAIAIKNQIPKVSWYSESKFPIKDIKWIAGQHYSTICRYMNQPSQQKKLYDKIEFIPNLWSAEPTQEEFIIAEDEFCNMFSMIRTFLSRGKNQTFVNILSENYLLRDYMRCNRQMFMSNPNAIPSLVPDYAKTERNTLLKLILLMSLRPVTEEEILEEFHLIGLETTDAFDTMNKLLKQYTFADGSIFTVTSRRRAVDENASVTSCTYYITDEEFNRYFSDSLKNAYYILEDEKCNEGYIDAKLFSHITQTVLPGQFVTYDGKYYMVKYISPQSGVVLRRASDQFDGRRYYRQLRSYHLEGTNAALISKKNIGDIEFSVVRANISVTTSGYLDMEDNHNLRTAKVIDFSDDPAVKNYSRKYRNKFMLRIKLPESDDKIRFTVCMLMSEIFRTVFPDGWQYLAVLTKCPEDIDGMLNYITYAVDGDVEDDYIYIVEDSDIDLGLLNAIEKNFNKLMEIEADFLEWHFEKMREPASKDPIPVKVSIKEKEEAKKRNLILKMLDRIRKIFGGKKQEDVQVDNIEKIEASSIEANAADGQQIQSELDTDNSVGKEITQDKEYELGETTDEKTTEMSEEIAPASEQEEYSLETDAIRKVEHDAANATEQLHPQNNLSEDTETFDEDEFMPKGEEDPDLVAIDGTDIFDNEGMPEDNEYLESSFAAMGLVPITKSRYQRECFLKFGFEEIDSRIKVDEVRRYLRVRGWSNNSLTLARKREIFAKNLLDIDEVNHCDFCGLPLSGISYEYLSDGRVRCNDCSSSAINNLEDFRELFYKTLQMMEDFYDIRYRVPISVKTVDAKAVAKGAGIIFKSSTKVSPRVLGYAQRKSGTFSLVIENGSPRLAATDTMVHEMTHIWQYLNWTESQVESIYEMNSPDCTMIAREIVYEGMAMWASIQYLYQIGETYYASQQEAMAEARKDIYGIGFRLYKEQYPLVKDSSLLKYSPFLAFPTLEPAVVRDAVRSCCNQKECKC